MSKAIRILIAVACSFLVISAIFFFSEQSGGESYSQSTKVASALAKAITSMANDKFSERDLKTLEKALNLPVRKMAHLSIYFGLGFVLYLSVIFVLKGKSRPVFIWACLLVVIAVATADEINQYFQEGRGSSATDVLIDTVGGALGIYFYYIITDFVGHVKNLFKKKESNSQGDA